MVGRISILSTEIKFEPRDIWIGLFWTKSLNVLELYFCIIPMLPIIIRFIKD